MPQVTIIGAGIAGLVCAALAQARGLDVTVVEAGPKVGGLWRSTDVELDGHRLCLDAGLRLPVATGEDRLDALLFHRPDFAFEWTYIDGWPRESAITAGRFNAESSCLDATVLGSQVSDVIVEMRSVEGDVSAASSALDHAQHVYGSTLANGLIRNAVVGMFGMDLAELDAKAVDWFVPCRVVLGDAVATAALLADERLSDRVAHARHVDLPHGGSRKFLRPRAGGISTWVRALHASLSRAGVAFILNDGLERAGCDLRTGKIRRLELRSGRALEAGHVICTVAPSVIVRAVGIDRGSPPPFRDLHVTHMLVDHAPVHRASYCLNFNRDAAFFRAIFHDNLGDVPAGGHVLTFEHLMADDRDLSAAALAQSIATGAMPEGTEIVATHRDIYRNAIVVPTIGQAQATAALRPVLSAMPNLHFVGRSAGGAPFLDRIIHEAAQVVSRMEQDRADD